MPRQVAYHRQTIDNPNPIARFAHRARYHHTVRLIDRYVGSGARLLDLGAGTGALLDRLSRARPDIEGIAFEPFMPLAFPDIRRETDLDALAGASFDAVSAFEVFEHLTDPLAEGMIDQAERLLRPTGRLLVSVPIMEGLGLPIKEVSRMVLFRRGSDYRPGEVVQGLLGAPVSRASDPLTSHKGFAHRVLMQRLAERFRPIARLHSPFPVLPWWANSQAFGVYERR